MRGDKNIRDYFMAPKVVSISLGKEPTDIDTSFDSGESNPVN